MNDTLTFALTSDQWAAAKALLVQRLGLRLAGDSGQVESKGVVVHYEYAQGQLACYVVKREFFDPSVTTIDQDITAALATITAGTAS